MADLNPQIPDRQTIPRKNIILVWFSCVCLGDCVISNGTRLYTPPVCLGKCEGRRLVSDLLAVIMTSRRTSFHVLCIPYRLRLSGVRRVSDGVCLCVRYLSEKGTAEVRDTNRFHTKRSTVSLTRCSPDNRKPRGRLIKAT